MRLPLSAITLLLPLAAIGQEPPVIAPTDAKSPADELKAFKLPPGFAAQLVASEPDIQKPMQCAFDAKGRLWVTTSHLYPFPAADETKATDKLFILSEFGPDGKARKVETFAENLNIPIGILPMPDCKSCIVSRVGQILKLTDTTGAGKADKREVLFTGFGTRDTHGMTNSYTLMPDGWVYACHGYLNDSRVKGKDGHEVHMQSGNTFRFRPDGSRIEIYTHGQVNPFGIAIDPWFNLYTADCHTKPITQLIPGAWYDSFGKPHDGLGYAPHVAYHDHGSTALCGLTWYDADHFPKEYLGTMFLGNVVTNKINFDKIEWKGSTPVAKEQPDFLVSGDPWFRPTDIKLGPDGALYVTDFYNKIIGHYEVDLHHPQRDKDRGRIWRIVWKDKLPKPAYSDLTTSKLEDIDKLLGHPNLAVRLAATNELIRRRQELPARDGLSDTEKAHRLWAMEMADLPDFRKREGYGRVTPFVTVHMTRIEKVKDEWAHEHAIDIKRKEQGKLPEAEPKWTRAILETMTAQPSTDNVKPLLALIPKIPAEDTHLKYAARLALRNSLRAGDNWTKADFSINDPVVADVALGIPTAEAAKYVADAYKAKVIPRNQILAVAEFIGRNGTSREWSLVAYTRLTPEVDSIRAYEAVLRGVQAAGKKDDRDTLYSDLDNVFTFEHSVAETRAYVAVLKQAAGLVKNIYKKPLADKCRNWVRTAADASLRTEAFEALALYDRAAALELARTQMVEPTTPPSLQERAATILTTSRATVDQALLVDAFKTAPERLSLTIAAGLAREKVAADLLFAAVRAGQASPRLLQEKAVLDSLKAGKVPNADARVAELTKGLPSADDRLATILKQRAVGFSKAKPDLTAGKQLFVKTCAACHQIANEGGKVAPNLDGIGIRGADRLIEDVLDPNRNVDANFRATRFETTDGRVVTGLLRDTDGDVYIIADQEGKEIRLPKGVVDKQSLLATSPMPADVADKLKESEFYDLLGYLLSQRAK